MTAGMEAGAVVDRPDDGMAGLVGLRAQLQRHPVFAGIADLAGLRRFMRAHVFAVWDFMSLLKRLQRDMTCVEVPWMPRGDGVAAHLVNEIVLGEESDLGPDGAPASHLDIYLEAMREVGADTGQFERFLALVGGGIEPGDAMHAVGAPGHVRAFVGNTLQVARAGSTLEVMAHFFHGREDVIPQMFAALLARWRLDETAAPMFVFYLRRHIEVDGGSHGPMAARIIERAIAGDPERQSEVLRAAAASVRARIALWDGVHASLHDGQPA